MNKKSQNLRTQAQGAEGSSTPVSIKKKSVHYHIFPTITMFPRHLTRSFLSLLLSIYVAGVACEEVDCEGLAAKGKCHDDVKYMVEHCKATCQKWQQETYKFKGYWMRDGETFYDISMNNSIGKEINFERFEGYVPLIIPMAKTCEGNKVEPSAMFEAIEELHSANPFSVEIIVFPFEHPSVDYSEKNCENFEREYTKPERKIHVMEMSKLSGPDANPIFQLINNVMGAGRGGDEVNFNTTAYFVVHPELTSFEYHYGKSLEDMKVTMYQWVKVLEGGEREL